MTILVDANVLIEATKKDPDARVVAWLTSNERDLVVDPIILGEISFSILNMPRSRRRKHLEQWFSQAVQRIQCLDWDAKTGLRWSRLLADLRAAGQAMPIKDSLIAATALTHGLVIATRNRRDFEKTGVAIVDPFVG